MAWSLEIHHIGLDGAGDATLILAINDGFGANQQAQVRSMLIDGGVLGEHAFVDAYINATLGALPGPPPLDVVVVTHYDQDHFNGIRGLLELGGAAGAANIYDNVIIFDQGHSVGNADPSYGLYINAINLRGLRARVTERVYGLAMPPAPPPPPAAGAWRVPDWLLNDEIMWTNAAGAARTPAQLLGAAAGTNLNHPTVTCIAGNQFVQGAGGVRHGGMALDLKNEHSLGFIVEFNNFRYYIAGDLEIVQENQVQLFLNPADDLAGRVVAIKTSHHGGNTSTSRAFLDRLKPDAAFISCGNANPHSHPAQQVVNVLDGYPWAAMAHAAAPPPSPHRPVSYYLTGYQLIGPPPQSYGDPQGSMVAGDPTVAPHTPGHIVLTVTEIQSNRDQRGESYIGVREATRWAARGTGVINANALPMGVAAANAVAGAGINTRLAAVQAAALAAAAAAGAVVGGAVSNAANLAATNEATGNGPGGNNYTPLTIANHTAAQTVIAGGTATQAAVAGAAAGAAFASGERTSASLATQHALLGAGIGVWPAFMANGNCLNAISITVGGGLFDVSFHDYFMMPAGNQNITHTG